MIEKLKVIKDKFLDNKKVLTPFIMALLLVITANFSNFTPSNAKYILEEDNALTYQNGLYELFNNEPIIGELYAGSNHDTIFVHFTFPRNEYGVGYRDVYSVGVPSACKIEAINFKGDQTNPSDVVYEKEDKMDNMDAIVSCPVESVINKDTDRIQIPITITENINNEGYVTYRYGAYNSSMTLDDYHKRFPKEEEPVDPDVIVLEEDDAFLELVRKLKEKTDVDYRDYVEGFLEKYKSNMFDIPGLEFLSKTKPYKVKASDSFNGYIRTYKDYVLKDGLITMYFSSSDVSEQNKAFEYYIKEWYEPVSDVTKDEIIKYVKSLSENGISNLIIDGKTINGFIYASDVLTMNKEVEDYAHNYLNKELRVKLNSSADTMLVVFNASILMLNDDIDSTLSRNIVIKAMSSLTKNQGSSNIVKFTDYYIVDDTSNNRKILVKVYSEGKEYNYATLEKMEINNNIAITFTNTDAILTVSISTPTSATSKEEIESVLTKLNNYFSTSIDSSSITDENGTTKVEFTVNK